MKKHSKILLTIVCAVLLVVSTVFATLAYFTDADEVTNTFTVGKVGIELHETGEVKRENGTVGKDYHLIPGMSYVKDPTVTVEADSEESYIRMLVTPDNMEALAEAFPDFVAEDGVFLLQNLVKGWDPAIWVFEGFDEGVYEFRYHETVSTVNGSAKPLEPLFTDVVVPGTVDNAHLAALEGIKINVVAHAIQAAGFADADAAWEAFDDQYHAEPEEQETTAPAGDGDMFE